MTNKTRKKHAGLKSPRRTPLNKTFKKFNKSSKYPYKKITKTMAIEDFQKLKKVDEGNWRSIKGIRAVDYGTYKLRVRTKYRGKSNVERWKLTSHREKMLGFAQRLHTGTYNKSGSVPVEDIIRSAISLAWSTINSMRPAYAMNMYKAHGATRVLDITAGWGSRMVGAMAADIDYIGIDSNKKLKPAYNKIKNAFKKESNSNVKLLFQKAETVDFSKLGYYDFVFTSPPYEYLELYEGMEKYDGEVGQASSGNLLKGRPEFYEKFLIPTLKAAYKYLPKGKFLCLNMPDSMYDEIKARWKSADKCDVDYMISKRH
jgi:16S rRNA G966 N2-methylase RsmD